MVKKKQNVKSWIKVYPKCDNNIFYILCIFCFFLNYTDKTNEAIYVRILHVLGLQKKKKNS